MARTAASETCDFGYTRRPIEERGISAITRHVANELDIPRAMAFLDPDIADYHKPNADHHGDLRDPILGAFKLWRESTSALSQSGAGD